LARSADRPCGLAHRASCSVFIMANAAHLGRG
jgi:hypothetical protein